MARSSNEMVYTVSSRHDGFKLRDFVLQTLQTKCTSSKEVRKLIDSGFVKVNGRLERFGSRILSRGDEVQIRLLVAPKIHERLQILFEDPSLIVISKPAGCISTIEALARRGDLIQPTWHLVHRLDKETSGALLIAKTETAKKALEEQFFEREVQKTYLALVVGRLPQKEGTMTAPLSIERKGKQIFCHVDPQYGLKAITNYRLRVAHKNVALLEVSPKTGRTHQIRVHLFDLGCPIVGEKVYHKEGISKERADRQLLHAYSLHFVHPITKEDLLVRAPIPEDMKQAILRFFPDKGDEVICEYS